MIHLKRHMKRKLINLAIGELVSVVVFWLNFFVFKELIVTTYSIAYVMILSFMIWLFAVIEWINYYKLQLSYDINPTVLFKYIRQRKLKKSKIAKEIEKAKK